MTLALTDILVARNRIAGRVLRTPLRHSAALGGVVGRPVALKCEHHQITGSFKLRGATNAILALSADARAAGIAAASTGNHGRALAHAAREIGVRAVICMSSLVPANKVEAVAALGAEVRIVGRSQDEAQAEVDRLVAREGMTMVPPFDDPAIIAGQGTIGLEMIADAPETDTVIVPLSGGGLIAGVALAAKSLNPRVHVIGVTMERGAAMHASLAAGHPVEIGEVPSLADSLGGGIGLRNAHTFAMAQTLLDRCILVSEEEIAQAVRYAYEVEGEVLEGAAAVGIAALLTGKVVPEGPVGLVLSGRNIAPDLHRRIINGETPDLTASGEHVDA